MNKGRGLQQQCQYVIDFRAMLSYVIGYYRRVCKQQVTWNCMN